jgi:Glycosyl transferase family 2
MVAPLLSVIIPVGPAHRLHCRQAAASALAQTIAPWGVEVIVCPDSDTAVAPMRGVTVLDAPGARTGPAATRNRGIAVASGTFVIFLDADDYLLPTSAEIYLRRFAQGDASYVYGDAYTVGRDGGFTWARSRDYIQEHQAAYNIHTVTALVTLDDVRAVGGFDEGVDAWEDWTLWLRLAIAGRCGVRTPLPAFVYRTHEGERMTRWYGTADGSAGQQAIIKRYQDKGIKTMASCCGGGGDAVAKAQGVVGALGAAPDQVQGDAVLVQFVGNQVGSVTLHNPATGNAYKLGNNAAGRYAYVQPADLEWLMERLPLQRVAAPPKAEPAPAPLPMDNGDVEPLSFSTKRLDALIAAREAETRELDALRETDIASPEMLDVILAQAEAALSADAGDNIAVNTPAESSAPRRGRKANHA